MKKYIYLVYRDYGYDGHSVDEDETKAFNSLDDAQSYRDYMNEELKQSGMFSDGNQHIITQIEHVTLK